MICLLRYKFQFTLTQAITLQTLVIRLQVPGDALAGVIISWKLKQPEGEGHFLPEPGRPASPAPTSGPGSGQQSSWVTGGGAV